VALHGDNRLMNTEDLYRLLRTSHAQAQGIVDTVPDPMIVLDASLCVQNANRAFFETFKVERDETIGRPLYELGDGQWDLPELRALLTQIIPKATAVINYEIDHDFPHIGRKVMLLTARTLYHPDGISHTMLLSISDATEQHRRDLAKDLLFGELRHRMKNLLGVTQAIALQTTTTSRSAAEYRDVFLGRLRALIEAEDIAFAEQSDDGLEQLLERTFAPYPRAVERVSIEPGPAVELGPHQVTALSLVLHELATNAAKHGALLVAGGQVRVGWHLENSNTKLRLEWEESGGPPVTKPDVTGFGTRLIRSTIAHNLQGELEHEYASEGYRAQITVPLGTASSLS
jgi:two-component sensor histidine kinase